MADWEESKHPRGGDPDHPNRFSEKGGSGQPTPAGTGTKTPREIPEMPDRPYSEYLAAHNGDHYEAAKDFYKTELQGGKVTVKIGDLGEKDVHFIGGKAFSEIRQNLKTDSLKAEAIPCIPDILRTGKYIGHGIYKPHLPYKEFHFFGKSIQTSVGKKYAVVDVGEREDGTFEYNVWSVIHEDAPGFSKKMSHLLKTKQHNSRPFADLHRDPRPTRDTCITASVGSHYPAFPTANSLDGKSIERYE